MRRDVSSIVLFDADKRILLQHRARDHKRLPDYWALFGGGIEFGETPELALRREAKEELNWDVQNPKKVLEISLESFGYETLVHVWVEKCLDKSLLQLYEGQGWGWFHFDEMKDLKISEWDRVILEKVDKFI